MKNEHKIAWRCCVCGSPTSTLHEIHFGRGCRDTCIKYHVQVPLCMTCHTTAHMERQDEQKRRFCDMLGLQYHSSKIAVEMKLFHHELEDGKEHRLEWLKGMEI